MIHPFGDGINSVQKALDLTIPAKNKENENNRSEFSDQKIDSFSAPVATVWISQENYFF